MLPFSKKGEEENYVCFFFFFPLFGMYLNIETTEEFLREEKSVSWWYVKGRRPSDEKQTLHCVPFCNLMFESGKTKQYQKQKTKKHPVDKK